MRIPITMCHGVSEKLDISHFEHYFRIAREMSFESISYDDLAAWRSGEDEIAKRPIMFDFDHPAKSIRHGIHPVMSEFGFAGTLFINTGPMEAMYSGALPAFEDREFMTWEEIGELMDAGWRIGSHTHTHPNLSKLCLEDPSGEQIRDEMEMCDRILERELSIAAKDFAFTGTSWSSVAEREVKKRYRFGRLWIIGSMYEADGRPVRYADLVGVPGADEKDDGPPYAARYITRDANPYKLPSMELERLVHDYDAFRAYLERALA